MGRFSAVLAIMAGLTLGAVHAFWNAEEWNDQAAFPLVAGFYLGMTALAAAGAYALLKMRGGMRVLAGAWGVFLGARALPLIAAATAAQGAHAGLSALPRGAVLDSGVQILVAAIGLFLVIAHRE